MDTLLALGLANAACAAVLAVPAFLVSRYGKRPALAHALWLLVLLKLVTPPVLRPGLAWLPAEEKKPAVAEEQPVTLTPSEVRLASVPVVYTRTPAEGIPPGYRTVSTTNTMNAYFMEVRSSSKAPTPPPAPEPIPETARGEDRGEALARFALGIWLGGAALFLGRALLHMLRFQRLLRHAEFAPAELQEQAQSLAGSMGLSRCPTVWLVPGPLPPMVWGVGSARVLFPAGLIDRLGADERATLLAHELAHVARRDHWVRVLELLAAALFWWYPLVWLARKQLHEREEECCDAWAKSAVSPRVYATAILEAVDFLSEAKPRLPAMASGLSAAKALKGRLTLILTTDVPRRMAGPTRMMLVGFATAVLPLLPTLVQADRPEPEAVPYREVSRGLPAPASTLWQSGEMLTVAFSGDGQRVTAGYGGHGRPGAVELFDVSSRKMVWRALEPRGVSWQANDAATARARLRLPLADGNARMRYSPDGRWLAATEGRFLRLLDARTGRVAHELAKESLDFLCASFSPDGRLMGAGGGAVRETSRPATFAFVLDTKTKRQVARLDGHTRAVVNLTFSYKNEFVATGSADNTVRVWDGKSFKLRNVLHGHTNVVHGVAFSPDNKVLATGSRDGSVRLWDPLKGKQLARLDGEPGPVVDLAFSPDGQLLVTGGEKRTVKLWDVASRKELATLRRDGGGQAVVPRAVTMYRLSGDQAGQVSAPKAKR